MLSLSSEDSFRVPSLFAMTPDGRRVVGISNRHAYAPGSLMWWDTGTGAVHTATGPEQHVWSIAVTDSGRHAVVALNDGMIEVWDLEEVTVQRLTAHSEAVMDVTALERDRAASVSHDGMLKIWDLVTSAELAVAPVEKSLTCVAVSPSGSAILVGDHWGNVHALQLATPEPAAEAAVRWAT